MTSRTATFIGFTAIMMWSLLALLTAASGRVPPFQLAAMTFAIGGLLGAASWTFRAGGAKAYSGCSAIMRSTSWRCGSRRPRNPALLIISGRC
jgi:hypothetical protein